MQSHGRLSTIQSFGSGGSADLQSIVSVSSLEANTIQPDGRVNHQPEESTIPGDGFTSTLKAICRDRCNDAGQGCNGSCWNKMKAFFMFITTPLYVLLKPFFDSRSSRRKVGHPGIIYFYILMACNIIFNLWEQRNKEKYHHLSYQFLQYFEATIMVFALIAMLYIAWATRRDFGNSFVNVDHDKNLILYFRTGLYVFGVSSMVYTALNIYNNCSCRDGLNIVLNIAKFMFIVGQILFLNYFFKAKLSNGGWGMQISFAHILSTNLSLWIWTLCKEVHEPHDPDKCDTPIYLGHAKKYFYPLFVEYLLLVASMVYELWMDLKPPAGAKQLQTLSTNWVHEKYMEEVESVASRSITAVPHPVRLAAARRRRKFTPSVAFSFVLGLAFSSIFLAFILAANDSASKHKELYMNFVIANICFYATQIFACYVIKVCSQSQPRDRKRSSLNLDDTLLYFGLAGIVLWEGFHFYALLFESYKNRKTIYFAHGLLGMIEDIVQTIILVSVRRLSSRRDINARTISNVSLFLLATNLAFWLQNSFYIEQQLENPGEGKTTLETHLDVFANILNPIIIFFRFHSATCCYQMWYYFSDSMIIDN